MHFNKTTHIIHHRSRKVGHSGDISWKTAAKRDLGIGTAGQQDTGLWAGLTNEVTVTVRQYTR